MDINKEMKKLYGSIKLNGESVFAHNISQDKEKYLIYLKAVKDGKISDFDQTTLTRLRKLYYGFYSAIIYLYYEPTDFNNIANKLELLTHVLEDKKFNIVHGSVDSTRDIKFYMYGVQHLDFNSWIEVEEGTTTWVYDVFSLLKFEKNTYYELEHPTIRKIIPGDAILNHPGRDREDYSTFHDGFIEILFKQMPIMEKSMDTHPFRHILAPELTRFKKDINYDELKLRITEEERTIITK